jgi:hypothetical protein
MSERNVVLLLDLAIENPIEPGMVYGQIGAEAPTFRVTSYGAPKSAVGTPTDWPTVSEALDRLLTDARAHVGEDQCRFWVAGRAGLPAFFQLGHRLSRKARVTLVNPRDSGPPDVLILDTPSTRPKGRYFDGPSWPASPSHVNCRLALAVSSRIPISIPLVERTVPEVRHVAAVHSPGDLDALTCQLAIVELDDTMRAAKRWFQDSSTLSVFVLGPATLAFLVGRSINPRMYPDVDVYEHRDNAYRLAYRSRTPRAPNKILAIAANPCGPDITIDEELGAIKRQVESHGFQFETVPAATPADLVRELDRRRPTILHVSGHARPGELVLAGSGGSAHPTSAEGLASALGDFSSVRLVFLNACYSEELARPLLHCVECVIGMRGRVPDPVACAFAETFYGALGEGLSIAAAFTRGKARLALGTAEVRDARDVLSGVAPALSDRLIPQLLVRDGLDPETMFFSKSGVSS